MVTVELGEAVNEGVSVGVPAACNSIMVPISWYAPVAVPVNVKAVVIVVDPNA